MKPVKITITIECGEGYEGVHPELLVADFLSKPDDFTFHVDFNATAPEVDDNE